MTRERKRKNPYPQLRPLWTAVFIDILGFSLLIPFLPFFMNDFNATPFEITLVLAVNAFFSFISGPILGKLSDKYGRKPLLIISQVGTLAGFLVLAFSTKLWMVFLSRIIDGIFGGNYPISKAVVADVVKPEDRAKQLTNIGILHVLSNIVGPALGAALGRFGIIGPGLVASGLSVIMIIQTLIFLPETAPIKTGVILVAQPTTNTINSASPKNQNIWKNRTARYLLIQWIFTSLSFIVYISNVSLFANLKIKIGSQPINPQQLGLLLAISGIIQIIIRFTIFIPMLKKWGETITVKIGLGVFVVSYFAMIFVNGVILFSVVLLGVSFGAISTRGILSGFLSKSVPPSEQGKVMGFSSSIDSISQIIGPLLGGLVLTSLQPLYFGLLPSFLSLVGFLMMLRKLKFNYSQTIVPLEKTPTRVISIPDPCIENAAACIDE